MKRRKGNKPSAVARKRDRDIHAHEVHLKIVGTLKAQKGVQYLRGIAAMSAPSPTPRCECVSKRRTTIFLEKWGENADNGCVLNEACIGCVFQASVKYHPGRECGPGS